MILLFSSYCVHNEKGKRGVSSGQNGVESTIIKSTPIGEWKIEFEIPDHPNQAKIIKNVSYKCQGSTSFQNIPDPNHQFPVMTFHDSEYPMNIYPFVSDPTSWAEHRGTRTYRNHRAERRNQDLKTVVFIKFLPWAVDVDFSQPDPRVLEESGELQQLVLDLQLVCAR